MSTTTGRPDSWYEIRLQGRLDPRWSAWFDGLTLTTGADGTTILRGPVVDQAALHGLLQRSATSACRSSRSPRWSPTPKIRTTRPQETVMTTTARPTTATRAAADPTRNHARAAGIFYLITFAASLPAFFLIGSAVNPDLTVAAGHDTDLLWAGLLDFVNALACVGTAVALFPVLKRQNQSLALGFVTSRLLEAAIIMTGVVSLLAVGHPAAGPAGTAGRPRRPTVGQALVAVRDWTFLFGPGFMACHQRRAARHPAVRSAWSRGSSPRSASSAPRCCSPRTSRPCSATTSRPPASRCSRRCPIAFWELSVGTGWPSRASSPRR